MIGQRVGPALAFVLGIALAACASGTGDSTLTASARGSYRLPVGTSSHEISVDGTIRTFLIYRPARLPQMAPVVVVLHPDGSSGGRVERDYHWNAEATGGRFIVAYPDGLHSSWNVGGHCCYSNANDVGFISDMVSAIESQYPIDHRRIYATGMSSGGLLAYALACQTTIFAAIAPVSATQLSPCPNRAEVSVLHIHGTGDRIISYYPRPGGAIRRFGGPDIPRLNALWRRIDRCAAPVITISGVVTTSIAACLSSRTVELITIAGMGHQWPRVAPDGFLPSTARSATHVIWEFFANHDR